MTGRSRQTDWPVESILDSKCRYKVLFKPTTYTLAEWTVVKRTAKRKGWKYTEEYDQVAGTVTVTWRSMWIDEKELNCTRLLRQFWRVKFRDADDDGDDDDDDSDDDEGEEEEANVINDIDGVADDNEAGEGDGQANQMPLDYPNVNIAVHIEEIQNDETIQIEDGDNETVALDRCIREQQEQQHAALVNQPSTSTGPKQKSSNASRANNNNKRPQTRKPKYHCKSPGCGKSFRLDKDLAKHERIHLGIKPYSCTWPHCKYASVQCGVVVRHIRYLHFKLPETVKKQNELNIVDDRDPNEFVRVHQELASRRL